MLLSTGVGELSKDPISQKAFPSDEFPLKRILVKLQFFCCVSFTAVLGTAMEVNLELWD